MVKVKIQSKIIIKLSILMPDFNQLYVKKRLCVAHNSAPWVPVIDHALSLLNANV